MEQIERIGVSLDKPLLARFDDLITAQGYTNRSEAIRHLIRQRLSAEQLEDPQSEAIAAVFLVYDHHCVKVIEQVMSLQHSHVLHTICATHIHLDAHDCLEVIILRGKVAEINRMGEQMLSLKGVKLGRINLISTQMAPTPHP